jgi:ABC-type sugar transport system permease subunit
MATATASLMRGPKRPAGGLARAQRRAGLLLALPAVLHFLLTTSIPVAAALGLSFTSYSPLAPPSWVGLDNYRRALADELFWIAAKNTALYVIGLVPISMALGLALALALNERIKGRALYRTAYYLPHVTAASAAAVIWLWIYNPQFGLLNSLFQAVGLPRQSWLANPSYALWAVLAVGVWLRVGYLMVIYLAALQGIPESLYEAAALDGANRWQRFRWVTLPLLRPATFFALVVTTIEGSQVFQTVYVMTSGGPGYATTTFAREIYRNGFEHFQLGYAAAWAFLLFAIVFAITMINRKLVPSDVDYV